ncbi:MAG: 2-amino-4-hydroxy-6-hydroxymethyldihydropteridine diphosphokinase [Candidatus Zixiibacteriota bacterium]
MSIAYIGLGSNLNHKMESLDKAVDLIEHNSKVKVLKRSSVYQTEPVGIKDQPFFLNMVLEVETEISPFELLFLLQDIERKMGRKREKKWGPRNIDLDLLLYEDQVINSAELTLPHPQMHLRKFVLVPLAEITEDRIHPLNKKTISELLKDLKEDSKVELFIN